MARDKLQMMGLANQEKFLSAEEHYSNALKLTEDLYGSNSKETIPILQALSQIDEKRKGEEPMKNVIRLNEQLMHIAENEYTDGPNLCNLLQLMQVVYRLSEVYLKTGDSKLEERTLKLLEKVLKMRPQSTNKMELVTDESSPIPTSARCNDDRLMSVSQQLLHSESAIRRKSEHNSIHLEQLRKQYTETSCSLRSLLIRIHLSNKRYESGPNEII
ncbi:unnamed protein product [Echinostoma caproni]|uniref:TPR_REGION domain-containing protein n=1 Tax=Echinostoma caproni TaxID=27848 RepID=A0A183AEG7_9TREM|nr:unnamed protein product [Echinostoma caproni]